MSVVARIEIEKTKLEVLDVCQKEIFFQFDYHLSHSIKYLSLAIQLSYYGTIYVVEFKRKIEEKLVEFLKKIQKVVNERTCSLFKDLYKLVSGKKMAKKSLDDMKEEIEKLVEEMKECLKMGKEIEKEFIDLCPDTKDKLEEATKEIAKITNSRLKFLRISHKMHEIEMLRIQVTTVSAFVYAVNGIETVLEVLEKLAEEFKGTSSVDGITNSDTKVTLRLDGKLDDLHRKTMRIVLITANAMSLEALYSSLCNIDTLFDEENETDEHNKKECRCRLYCLIDNFIKCTEADVKVEGELDVGDMMLVERHSGSRRSSSSSSSSSDDENDN